MYLYLNDEIMVTFIFFFYFSFSPQKFLKNKFFFLQNIKFCKLKYWICYIQFFKGSVCYFQHFCYQWVYFYCLSFLLMGHIFSCFFTCPILAFCCAIVNAIWLRVWIFLCSSSFKDRWVVFWQAIILLVDYLYLVRPLLIRLC